MILPHASSGRPPGALDLNLIRKYSVPGPRYTSYPPATKFAATFGPGEAELAIRADNATAGTPLSLYFHLPFCETRCWFCGCNTVITRRREAASEYLEDLEREMDIVARLMRPGRPVTQIHLGGGTPTFLPPEQLVRLGTMIRDRFPNFSPQLEFGVEVDPRRLTAEHVAALQAIGANRASLGVQDTNPRVQIAIHRHQPHPLNEQTINWLRQHGFRSINVDLIFGLPLQTPASFGDTIGDVLNLNPDRLSVFSYAHVPWIKPAQRIFEDRGQLPDAESKLAMFAAAHERLTTAGYTDIGLDHFARPDDELAVALAEGTLHRNFQGYSTRGGSSLYAFGVSSISSTADTYTQNLKSLPEWRDALAAGRLPVERGLRLSAEDTRRREVIMGLMCERRIDYARMGLRLGLDFCRSFAAEIDSLSDLEADGIVERDAHGLRVTATGVPLLRVVAMRFDPTIATGATQHSKTI